MELGSRLRLIILKPKSEWEKIRDEKIEISGLLTEYAMILAAIGPVANFIGLALLGRSILGERITLDFSTALMAAVLSYVFTLGVTLFAGFIIDLLGTSFGAARNINHSMKVAVFAMTPAWIAGIFALIPALAVFQLLGLYSIYLLYEGLRIVKNPTPEKLIGYTVVVLIVTLAATLVAGMVVSMVAVV